MLKATFKKISWLFTPNNAFHHAIDRGDRNYIEKLLLQGIDPDTYHVGYTPLQISLIHNKLEFVLLFLENNANPKADFKSENYHGKTIQFPINAHKASHIKLLALYGADLEGVTFINCKLHFRQLIFDKLKVFYRRKELEQCLNKSISNQERIEIYKELSQLWEKQCENESEPIYKAHYQRKAADYQQKALSISLRDAEEQKLTPEEQELIPLLNPSSSQPANKLKQH